MRLQPQHRQALALLAADRDFNAEDYDTLLALDDARDLPSTQLARATGSDLQALPVYTMTAGSSAVSGATPSRECAVCLDSYVAGDRLRILPCMHQFHECCIDKWLTEVCESRRGHLLRTFARWLVLSVLCRPKLSVLFARQTSVLERATPQQ